MRKITLAAFVIFVGFVSVSMAQNVAITDDNAYSAQPLAMLDVKSTNKGMLVPRLNTSQRTTISAPANGLLVFDTDFASFFYYNGNTSTWVNLATPINNTWSANSSGVYLTNTGLKLGVGTVSPNGKLEIQGDGSGGADELLMAVKNSVGDTIFAVYNGGVRIYVDDSPSKSTGSRGGFAVGGISSSKGTITNEFLRVTPDSVRIYVDNSSPKSTGSRGGFAVGGISSSKGSETDFLQITKDNYFIGLGAGARNTTGLYNSFMGYQAGFSNITGNRNIFLGYQAGYKNVGGLYGAGDYNIFFGNLSGYSNLTGNYNLFLGYQAGNKNTSGNNNIFIGYNAGYGTISGHSNTYLGFYAGATDTTGFENIYIGNCAGYHAIAGPVYQNYRNVIIGSYSGYNLIGSSSSTYVGYATGRNTTEGFDNSFFGSEAGESNVTGSGNTYMGCYTGGKNTTGSYNSLVGQFAGYNLIAGFRNTIMGESAGYAITSGHANVILGASAAYSKTGGTGNILIGYEAGTNDTGGTGDYNVSIGYQAGYTGSGDKNVFIGYQTGYYETGSNKLFIDNSNTTIPLIYGNFASDSVIINGTLKTTGALSVASLATTGAFSCGALTASSISTTGILGSGNLTVTGTGSISSNFTVSGTSTFTGNLAANGNILLNSGTYFRVVTAPGSGATPLSYVYQGISGSSLKNDAFSIYDALWVTGNSFFDAGITSTGALAAASISTAGTLSSGNLSVTGTGNISSSLTVNGNLGIGSTGLSYDITLDPAASRTIGVERRTGILGAGSSLTVQAGGSGSGASSKAGGNLYLVSGISTGNTGSNIYFNTATPGALGGTVDHIPDTKMTILGNGWVGIGRTPMANDLEVEGTASKAAAGTWTINSDRRIKTDIADISNAEEIILKLHPVMYKYSPQWLAKHPKIENRYYYNYIAQEYREVFPESVKGSGEYLEGDSNEILQLDSYNTQIVAIKALQELYKLVDEEQKQIEVLTEDNKELKKQLENYAILNNEIEKIKAELIK